MEEENKQIPTWSKYAGVFIVIILILILGYVTVTRYHLVGKSIDKSDLTTSVVLMSPELSAGIGHILRSL